MNLRNILALALVLVLGLPLYLGCGAKAGDEGKTDKAEIKMVADGPVAADFTLKDLEGKDAKFSDFKGKVIILDFWATWCPPCVKEIPHFNELYKEYIEKGLVVLGVSLDDGGAQTVIDFMANRIPISYPVVMGDRETGGVYQNYLPQDERGGIPFTFVIDREGVIRHHFVGYRDKEVFVEAIKPLL